MKPIIQVEKIGKRYQLGQGRAPYSTAREALVSALRTSFMRRRGNAAEKESVWALKDVSFEVDIGEVVGIIGRNGAGKSTLLKILSRITEPTTGRARLYGRVGSLLEVGTGFHPELTGKENIYLNGAILGMRRSDIKRRFDEIVAFAEVQKFINTPVKRYSSGMYLRLAFAVAAFLEPEILVVDEVLAVGDSQFQKKCLGKIGDVAKEGRTVLFVSHNMAAVGQLCTKGILLSDGQVTDQGPINEVINTYILSASNEVMGEVVFPENENSAASITRLCLLNEQGEKTARLSNSDSFTLEIEYIVRQTLMDNHVWVALDRADGLRIIKASDDDNGSQIASVRTPGQYLTRVRFPGGLLNEGVYRYSVVIGKQRIVEHDYKVGNYFEIEDNTIYGNTCLGKRNGVLRFPLTWDEQQVKAAAIS